MSGPPMSETPTCESGRSRSGVFPLMGETVVFRDGGKPLGRPTSGVHRCVVGVGVVCPPVPLSPSLWTLPPSSSDPPCPRSQETFSVHCLLYPGTSGGVFGTRWAGSQNPRTPGLQNPFNIVFSVQVRTQTGSTTVDTEVRCGLWSKCRWTVETGARVGIVSHSLCRMSTQGAI